MANSGSEGAQVFEHGQREVLEHIAAGEALPRLLKEITQLIETQEAGMLCSILLLDREQGRLRHGAAPSLPPEYVRAIDGAKIGPQAGSCGTAAYLGRRVIVEDIATDPAWEDWRALALPFGLRACWSSPIFSSAREVMGTFAMYFREIRGPSAAEIDWIERATHLAAIAIERKRAEERIRSQAALLDSANDAILVRDLDGTVRYWNNGAARLYGWRSEEAVGRKVSELLYRRPEAFEEAQRQVLDVGAWHGELEQVARSGRALVIYGSWTLLRDEQGRPSAILAINTDVTENKKLEARLLRANRMESLGRVAGSIAHDFNNILSAILTFVQMGKLEVPPHEPVHALFSEIEEAGSRATSLVRQILTFSRDEPVRKGVVDLGVVMDEALRLLRLTKPRKIEIDAHVAPNAPKILADSTQVHQVVMNLCTNAVQATGEGGGLISVRIERRVLERDLLEGTTELGAGTYALLAVEDAGDGMDETTLERIFDPFFTTKAPGKGTGLGLSVVHGIVRSHSGAIVVRSMPGKGTRFEVYFPAMTTSEPAAG